MSELTTFLEKTFTMLDEVLEEYQPRLQPQEVGTITFVEHGIVRAQGLPHVQSEEVIRFPGNRRGIAFNLDPDEVAIVLLDESETFYAGQEITRTGRIVDVPVGEQLLGRIVDPLGRPLDEQGPLRTSERRPIERPAPAIMDRSPVSVPLQTGLQAIDALIPIGRGQRELILGDRQTGKSAIALDTVINQRDKNVLSVYCLIGKQPSDLAKLVADLRRYEAMDTCIVVVATGEDPPGLNYVAPYAATAMAEYFMDQGQDALVVYDDLTRHARAYRELSLLLRRPPAREAYPGDIFYIHSRLLERATHLSDELGGGSMTALPIIETQAENMSAYIPTNLISITDGQIYLSPRLFQEGVLPAIDVGKSVSRVGGKTQLAAYRAVAGDLRLSYSQFRELENFARFGTQLDEETQQTLERGRRVREILKQPQYQPIPVPEQIAVLFAVTEGVFDDIPLADVSQAKRTIQSAIRDELPDVKERIMQGEALRDEDRDKLLDIAKRSLNQQ
ncbi:alternate F1F0 ATPase, F1 subunit alpha [candidate division KSB3 bacterium]|uniref:ATP synthase subunit alpha n=1 Tax=candidate division KSB3 bacterium TaxID=2044937 RepID=A0A9D5JY00_9BACT|nr:alternate F1F0 ATPase, F1 subunit alpha [candidate division KSB3 bacterium]MBD3325766.1 alternate F1F0 ATPase, F1 subunit alpha [candidate division KSB3 bacterium]